MGFLDKMKDKANAHVAKQAEMVNSLPAGTRWAAAVEVDHRVSRQSRETRGLLSHDGVTVSFLPWSGDFSWAAPVTVVQQTRDGFKLHHGDIKVKVEDFRLLRDALPLAGELPTFAATEKTDDRTCGFFSSLEVGLRT